MLHADLMVRTNDGSLEQRPRALKRVRVSKSAHVFASLVVNRNMDRIVVTNSEIGIRAVRRNDFRFIGKFGFQESAQVLFAKRVLTVAFEDYIAVAFNRAKDNLLASNTAANHAASFLIGLVHPFTFAADECLVALNK